MQLCVVTEHLTSALVSDIEHMLHCLRSRLRLGMEFKVEGCRGSRACESELKPPHRAAGWLACGRSALLPPAAAGLGPTFNVQHVTVNKKINVVLEY